MNGQPFIPYGGVMGGIPGPNNVNNSTNGPMINNFMSIPIAYNNFDFYGNMGMNNSMNMNMYNLMMNYFNLYYTNLQNSISNSNDNNNINTTRNPSSKMVSVVGPKNNNKNNYRMNLNQTVRNKSVKILDIFPEILTEKINVFFQTPEGNKVNVLIPPTTKMKDVLIKFVNKIGLKEDDIDNTIIFIYSARKIKKNEKRSLIEMGILNGAIIITMDKSGVLGA